MKWRKPEWMKGLRVSRRVVERLKIVAPSERREELHAAFPWEEGWRITYSSPYTNRTIFPEVDMTRFRMIVEREAP